MYNNIEYDTSINDCAKCPFDSIGDYPNCECPDGGYFDGEFCTYCPYGSYGLYPNCTCEDNAAYIKETNLCMNCPSDRYVQKRIH